MNLRVGKIKRSHSNNRIDMLYCQFIDVHIINDLKLVVVFVLVICGSQTFGFLS